MAQIPIALVGCGGMGGRHVRALEALYESGMANVELAQERVEPRMAFGAGEIAAGFKHGQNVLGNRELAEHGSLLWEITDPCPGSFVHGRHGQIVAIKEDTSGVTLDRADNHVETGGFASAVGAEQAHYATAAYLQGDVTHHRALLVALGKVLRAQHMG